MCLDDENDDSRVSVSSSLSSVSSSAYANEIEGGESLGAWQTSDLASSCYESLRQVVGW